MIIALIRVNQACFEEKIPTAFEKMTVGMKVPLFYQHDIIKVERLVLLVGAFDPEAHLRQLLTR